MDRKNIYRREETQRVRVDRIISGYVKYRHPDVFNEAKEYYEWLNTRYPEKKDLRRCNEFEMLKHGTDSPVRKYYMKNKKPHATVSQKSNPADTMVLQIPLMTEGDIANKTIQTDEITVVESSQPETVVGTPIPAVSHTELPPVSDEILEGIIRGLREDPDLSTFFEDIDFQFDDCPLW